MTKAFNDTAGKAIKTVFDIYKYTEGEQSVRLVGGVLPRYVYWLTGYNGKSVPVECLSFNRDTEKFDNSQPDPVKQHFPDVKPCQWSYSINCIDLRDGKVKILNLKKKLFGEIKNAAEDLGDPTDPETGWDVVFKRVKTGAAAWNVEYTLSVLRCKKRPLTEAEKAAVEESKSIGEKYPRPTLDEVNALCEKIQNNQSTDGEPGTDKEAVNELDG